MADAPVRMTATRFPDRSTEWSHREEWKRAPANVSMPSISGSRGSERPPGPVIRVRARTSPEVVRQHQTCATSSHVACSSSVPNTILSVTAYSWAMRWRYSWISGWGEYDELHSGLRANENE